ncbi:LPS assembly lipoprotein LptE [Desulfobacterota bacterium M19]
MTKITKIITTFLLLFLAGCGYYNPYIADSDSRPITLSRPLWVNNTGEIGLESTMDESLSSWLRKSKLIHLVDNPARAQYELTGTLLDINYPEISYGNHLLANELRANLRVSFSIIDHNNKKNKKDKKVVWVQKNRTFTETLSMSDNPITLQANKKEALAKITNDIAEAIYLHIINHIMRLQKAD